METSRLAGIPLLADLEDADLEMIAASAREVDVEAGQALATEGEFGHALFAIESGRPRSAPTARPEGRSAPETCSARSP